MSWRTVVITGHAKLDYKLDYLVVRKHEEVNRIHLSEIRILIIESTAVSLTTLLICEMIKRKIKIVFCDAEHNPHSETIPYYGSHDTSLKVKQQIEWSDSVKDLVWTEIVREKIRKQSNHLKELGYDEASQMLIGYTHEIELGDTTNREGHAAKVYFNKLFGLDFARSDDNSINAALNYGYNVLLSYFNREIVAKGYITQLGLFHDNMFNNFNFGSDLMEPFRILVDKKVVQMEPVKFEKDEKLRLIEIFNETVIIDGKRNFVANAIQIYCKSIFDALNEGDLSLIRFYRNEL